MRQTHYTDEFAHEEGIVYLNHAAVAPWPRRTVAAVEAFAHQNAARGALDYGRWMAVELELREQFRQLINAPAADDIALLKNTSEALSVVAYGLEWRAGDVVIVTDQEFPSNRMVWESLEARYGVEVRAAALDQADSPEDAIEAACDKRTRLISVSSVQYGSGLRMDLERLGRFCRRQGILFCIDAIQSLGALPFDVQAIGADFVAADGHKWLLGPEGVALFYCRAALRDKLRLSQFGWHMAEDFLNFDRQDWTAAGSARRFECGSPNMLGIHAMHASLSLLLEVGIQEVSRNVINNTSYLIEKAQLNSELQVLSPSVPERLSGIVTVAAPSADQRQVFKRLMVAGVVCARRGGGIRFSPHYYTPRAGIDTALAVLGEAVGKEATP